VVRGAIFVWYLAPALALSLAAGHAWELLAPLAGCEVPSRQASLQGLQTTARPVR
jgi:hypothetical protein